MVHRIEVTTDANFTDALGEATRRRIHHDLGLTDVTSVRAVNVYTLDDDVPGDRLDFLGRELFSDPIVDRFSVGSPVLPDSGSRWVVQVAYKPGVKDTVGEASADAISRLLGTKPDVYTSRLFYIDGDVSRDHAETIANDLLANDAVEMVRVSSTDSFGEDSYLPLPKVKIRHEPTVEYIDLDVPDDQLVQISTDRHLALNLEEMQEIRTYFKRPEVADARREVGLSEKPTDAELEVLAQTWSEHCKHKIFNAVVEYTDDRGRTRIINSLFRTYIRNAAERLRRRLPWIKSILWDNSGVVQFNEDWLAATKCETHNSPSNMDPYGGAITGIVGVYRDPMGTGKGCWLLYGTYGFCTGDPDYDGPLRPRLHPRRLLEGVRKGVEDGGNKHGVPTPWGTVYFDDGYMGKPAIYVRAGGLIPNEVNGEPGHEKDVEPGDLIVMCGGTVGIDGIHGATESSLEAGQHITMGHVQMGDPYMQKRMHDFLVEARDRGLYRFIQDNGAGGLSSSVGESATFSGGFRMDLAKVPLKYAGLDPWQIIVSESQERMTLAVYRDRVDEFMELARIHDVESTVLGQFTDDGKFHVTYGDRTVTYMNMEFAHDGAPQKYLRARWESPEQRGLAEPELDSVWDHGGCLRSILGRPNVASTEYITRQFDHEVQGTSAVKPLVGKDSDVGSDAVVLKPLYDSQEGLAISDGLNPRYNRIDTYRGTMLALEEAARRMVAVGANPRQLWMNDNFCWPSPLPSGKNPDAEYKMAQLVRANQALHRGTTRLGIPCVSGKDSMSMDGTIPDVDGKDHRVSTLPTIKFSGDGKVDDVRKCVTMDVKSPGDLVYVVGATPSRNELGGSEYYDMRGEVGLNVPEVDLRRTRTLYRTVHRAINEGLVASCHGCYRGGLGVALAQSSFAGGYGMDVDLGAVPKKGLDTDEGVLYTETPGRFVITVPKEKQREFERALGGGLLRRAGRLAWGTNISCRQIGEVTADSYLRMRGMDGTAIMDEDIGGLKGAWKAPYADR